MFTAKSSSSLIVLIPHEHSTNFNAEWFSSNIFVNLRSNWSDKPKTKSVAFTVLPYVRDISEKIRRLLNELDIKVALKQSYQIRGRQGIFNQMLNHLELSQCLWINPMVRR